MGTPLKISSYQRPVNLLEIANRDKAASTGAAGESSFKEMFSSEMAQSKELAFSKHASQRLHSRGIELSDQQVNQISDALDKAAAKGSRETLVLMDDVALVASVENRTVITAFDRDQLKDGVVTSIDSAVIL